MIPTHEHELIQKALKTKMGCQNMKSRIDSLYRLSMRESPVDPETIEEIVVIAEYALFELVVVRTIEERHDI